MIKLKDVPNKANCEGLDILAIVARVGVLKQTAKNSQMVAREIYIYDDSYTIIKLIVRDAQAYNETNFVAENIILLRNVRVLKVKQLYFVLVTAPETIIQCEANTPEAERLRSWFLQHTAELLSQGFERFYNLSTADGSFAEGAPPFDTSVEIVTATPNNSTIDSNSSVTTQLKAISSATGVTKMNTSQENLNLKIVPVTIKQENSSQIQAKTGAAQVAPKFQIVKTASSAVQVSLSLPVSAQQSAGAVQSVPTGNVTGAATSQQTSTTIKRVLNVAIPNSSTSLRVSSAQCTRSGEPSSKFFRVDRINGVFTSTPIHDSQKSSEGTIQTPTSPIPPPPDQANANPDRMIDIADDETIAEANENEAEIKIEEALKIELGGEQADDADVSFETFNALMIPTTLKFEWNEEKDKYLVNHITKNLNNLHDEKLFENLMAEKADIFEGNCTPNVLKERTEQLASVRNYFYLMLLCGGAKVKSEKEKLVFVSQVEKLRKAMKSLITHPME